VSSVPQLIRLPLTIALAGLMLGYAAGAAARVLMPRLDSENKVARQYMEAMVTLDAKTIGAMHGGNNPAAIALGEMQAMQMLADEWKPTSLTYLGGSVAGKTRTDIYVLGIGAGATAYVLTQVGGEIEKVK
jgi:hypothetical protein